MSYIGNSPTSVSFPTDTFSGSGSQTAFTLQLAPASTNSVIVAVSGVIQDPSTYSVSGTTITFSAAPPAGTSNISVRFLGVPGIPNTPTAGSVGNASFGNVTAIPFAAGPSLGAGNSSLMKNRIINGAMTIDQRNAGASVSVGYGVDRFYVAYTQPSKFTAQQNAGSVTPPVGFTNYWGMTSSSAYSVLTGDTFYVGQAIEGYNIADLGWGTANAKTVTLSFQVYSSLTGTFGGSITNSVSRSYPFSYSVPVANTWTTISVTIPGDTTGTWLKTNGIGISVWFGLGSGSTFTATANTWAGGVYVQPTGSQSVVGTDQAKFYITGVQLEVGSSATGFEYRHYGNEFALCRRYFRKLTGTGSTPLSCQGAQYLDGNTVYFSYQADLNDMRSSPTSALVGTANTDYAVYNTNFGPQSGFTFSAVSYANFGGVQFRCTKTSHGLTSVPQLYFGTGTPNGALTLSSEL